MLSGGSRRAEKHSLYLQRLVYQSIAIPDRYSTYRCQAIRHPLVVLVDQIYDDLHHHVLLLRAAFGYHKREGHQGVVSYALRAV